MLRTIKTISEFKEMANLTHANRSTASKNWGKTWGMGWWFDLWGYKEYTLRGLRYRTGQVTNRYTKHNVTKYYTGDNEISKEEFFGLIGTIEYMPKVKPVIKKQPQAIQLSLFA